MSNNTVAVLISTYNGEKYISEQIESVLRQNTKAKITIIVRDDGSSDNTPKILADYQKTYDNIEVIIGENLGFTASFFSLFQYAIDQGYEYYAFCDQDDYWLADKIETALKALHDINCPCLYSCCSKVVNENLEDMGTTTQKQYRPITFMNTAIQGICPGHNQIINKKLAKLVKDNTVICDELYAHDLWITNIAAVTGKIIFDNEPHTLYRQHEGNYSGYGKNRIVWIKDHYRKLKKRRGKKLSAQLYYFIKCYGCYISDKDKAEVDMFFEAQTNIITRIRYAMKSKLYRQKMSETLMFKIVYIFGSYNL